MLRLLAVAQPTKPPSFWAKPKNLLRTEMLFIYKAGNYLYLNCSAANTREMLAFYWLQPFSFILKEDLSYKGC